MSAKNRITYSQMNMWRQMRKKRKQIFAFYTVFVEMLRKIMIPVVSWHVILINLFIRVCSVLFFFLKLRCY